MDLIILDILENKLMTIKQVHRFEKILVQKLNKEGWNLKWTGGKYEHYDAKGYTKRKNKCVVEMKFRKDYYEEKLLEKFKYDKLMQLDKDIVKIYLVIDPKAMYLFWLDNINLSDVKHLDCPQTTLWENKIQKKEVYLLNETIASYIEKDYNYNTLI